MIQIGPVDEATALQVNADRVALPERLVDRPCPAGCRDGDRFLVQNPRSTISFRFSRYRGRTGVPAQRRNRIKRRTRGLIPEFRMSID